MGQEIPDAQIGVPLELTLLVASPTQAPVRQFALVAPADGRLTVDASSFDADVVLTRLPDDESAAVEADGGGIGWNARLVLDVRAGERVQLSVAFKESLAGGAVVLVSTGEPPLPSGFELGQAMAQFLLGCAQAAEARGDADMAGLRYHEAGQSFFSLGLLADCRTAYQAALSIAERSGSAPLKAVAQGFLGAVTLRFGDAAGARALLEPACEAAVAMNATDLEMLCLSNLGDACQQLGDLERARSACDRALVIARERKDVANEANLLSQVASLSALEGDPDAARESYAKARRMAEELGEPNRLAKFLTQEAVFHQRRGELGDAEECLLRALESATTPAVRAAALGELGNVRNDQGRWTEARASYQDVLDTARELGDLRLQAVALANLGVVAGRAGDTAGANDRLQSALDATASSGDSDARVRVLLELASLRFEQDRLVDSQSFLNQAKAVAQEAMSHELLIRVLHQEVLRAAKDPSRLAEAATSAEQMLDMSRSAGSTEGTSSALTLLAWVQLLQGQVDKAAKTAAESVEASRESAPHLVAAALSTQLDVALARGDLPTARAALSEAREMLAGMPLRELGDEGASLARSNWSYAQFAELEQDVVALGLAASRAAAEKDRSALIDQGFRAAGRAQARALLEGIAEHRSGRRDAKSIAMRHERQQLLSDRQAVLDAAARSRRSGEPTSERESLLERARQLAGQADAVLADLRRHAPGEASLDAPSELGPDLVRRDLLDDEVTLVQFAEGQERLYAYVLTKASATWHDLGPRDEIAEHVRGCLEGISDPTRLAGPGEVAKAGARAWQSLLRPLLPADGSGTLVVVPTPSLAGLPFEALVTRGDSSAKSFAEIQFVIDRYDVRYVPSIAVMSLLASVPARTGESRMLVLADPVVPGEELASRPIPRLLHESMSWARLPGTRTEALGIVELLDDAVAGGRNDAPTTLAPEERGGHLTTGLLDVYLGADATVARMKDAGRSYSIVHLAAHGAIDATDPARTGLLLSAAGEDDGFLSVPEVLELDLDADLVVLSACDTARGAVRRGEGVQSLARAFMYAGAREVVATLWQVDDRETEAAMRSLYGGIQAEKLGVPGALRAARLQLRNAPVGAEGFVGSGRGKLLPGAPPRDAAATRQPPRDLRGHPYFWGPFILIGWRPGPR